MSLASLAGKTMGLGLTLKTWFYVAIVVALLGAAAVSAGYGWGHGAGAASATAEAAKAATKLAAQVAAEKLEQQRLITADNDKLAKMELTHAQEVSDLRAQYAADQAAAQSADARALADLRSGNQRLRLQVNSCGAPKQSAPGSTTIGVDDSYYAELAPETSATLFTIASDGDAAIRKLTGLQAWAKSAVKLCSGTTAP